ncbi:uncharacterized protein LOC108233618 isoform X2 [Kryptolebias marmoratus]|uniref:uncharacterized protein LOC108233618 isoform X2 n=1 Tax=Kryptolebias marmoratus TaxID=37003 RepID=UPI0007F92C51|nr:uncharacterized protein LOC108233618 isoform X2 [Kryptolebias marmoratus]
MKPQEAELVVEISKLQCMVTELKKGFTSALLELAQIQQGDTYLREEMEESRRSCKKKALRLETLVESLRVELDVMRRQIVQLYNRYGPQDGQNATSKQRESSDPAERCDCWASCLSRGKLLLHCFLQGLKVGLSESTDARHQVAMQLLHSEWEYVLTLNQLYDKYKTPAAHQVTTEPHQTYVTFVEQLLQRHVLFRNTLQERLYAEHWKSLVGDILVQLIGHNETAFSDMYLGYTTTLASFLSLEFYRLNQPEKRHRMQSGQMEREEMKLLSLLLAPVARIHSYLGHIQNLLQWTGKEHPDCSLLLGSERALRSILARCHVILEEDVQWEEEEEEPGQSSSCDAAAAASAGNCCTRSQQMREGSKDTLQRDAVHLTNGVDGCHSMRLECWSCSPVRRKSCRGDLKHPAYDCARARRSLLSPDAAGWGENSDSGQGTFSQPTGKCAGELEAPHANHILEEETDPDDTSAFDYSSVTSCSPDGTLHRDTMDTNSGEDEDSQVPVLLKPSYSHQQQEQRSKETPKERTVCLRWQIPRLTPHPPSRNPTGPHMEGPSLLSSCGKRLVSVRRGSPPLHPKSAFRPIWDDPSKQGADSAPEKDIRQVFIPVPATGRPNLHTFIPSRENLRLALPQQPGNNTAATSGGGLWDSEDSEGPCSTV